MDEPVALRAIKPEWITVLLTIIGFSFVYWQVNASTRAQQDATANQIYSEYLKLSLEAISTSTSATSPATESLRKDWLASYFMNGAEKIYALHNSDKAWLYTLASQICMHTNYLASPRFQETDIRHYDAEFIGFVQHVLTHCGEPDLGMTALPPRWLRTTRAVPQ